MLRRIFFVVMAAVAVGLIFGATSVQAAVVTLDGTSGSNTISTGYSTDGGLTVDLGFYVDYLIVGGGGGGGCRTDKSSGGGGAGGLIYATGVEITSVGSVTVGAGGAGGAVNYALGDNGGDSILTLNGITLTALGGGGGGRYYADGKDGGSGGGDGGRSSNPGKSTQSQPPAGYGTAFGHDGGDGGNSGSGPGGGGGGAGASGAALNGGAGLNSDITGTSVGYAGGGGGSNFSGTSGGSASHGGGAGGSNGSGISGTANTGGGGGGSGGSGTVGGNGGSGVVVVRYAGPAAGTGGSISTVGGDTVHQFTSTGSSALDLSALDLDVRLGVTLTSPVTGTGDLTYNGPGLLTLAGDNTYTGNTTVSAGTLTLADTGSLLMDINDGGSNQLLGGGVLNLDGALALDVDGVTGPGSWLLADVDNLSETYGGTFSIGMNGGPAFTEVGDIWTYSETGGNWTFTEATGTLDFTAVIPEPSTLTLALAAAGLLCLIGGWRRRRR